MRVDTRTPAKYDSVSDLLFELERVRILRGESIKDAAREIGVSYCGYWRWVHGERIPSSPNALRVMEYIASDKRGGG